MTQASRREFVAAATATAATALTLSQSGHAAPGSELKLALVGCGGRGTGAAAQDLNNEGVKLVAMADAFEDKVEGAYNNLNKKYENKMQVPKENRFFGWDAYKKAIDACDIVILATSPGFRPIHFEYAVAQGKHVFMEKPVATDMAGIRKVLAAAKQADEKGLKVVVGLQRRYQKSYLDAVAAVRDGAIGDITQAHVRWNGGGVWERARQPGQTEMEYQMRNWYYFNWLCGDHITEQHVHNLDVANWVLDAYPISAEGMGGREVRNGKEHGEIYDHHYVKFTYASGAVVNSQCRHIRGCANGVDEEFFGTKGYGKIGKFKSWDGAKIENGDGGEVGESNPYQEEHNRLHRAIRNNEELNNAYYGAKSTATSIMGRLATYSGNVIKWDDAMKSEISLMPPDLSWDAMPLVLPDPETLLYPAAVPGKTKVL